MTLNEPDFSGQQNLMSHQILDVGANATPCPQVTIISWGGLTAIHAPN